MINNDYDINWHNIAEELPGKDYEITRSCFNLFLLRYTFEDEDRHCFYNLGYFKNGNFIMHFHDSSDEESEDLNLEARVIQWAFIDHKDEYIESGL